MKTETLICVLCDTIISIENSPRNNRNGHNAYPVSKGRCCGNCNDEKVLPFRKNLLKEQKIK